MSGKVNAVTTSPLAYGLTRVTRRLSLRGKADPSGKCYDESVLTRPPWRILCNPL